MKRRGPIVGTGRIDGTYSPMVARRSGANTT